MNELIQDVSSGYPISQYYEAYRRMRENKNKNLTDTHVRAMQLDPVERDDRDIFEALGIIEPGARLRLTTAIPFTELVFSK